MESEIKDQPPPVATAGRPVWEMVIEDVQREKGGHFALSAVLDDMRDRDRIGRERYGTPLQAHNGRDALTDAYQEALDCAVYLRQDVAETHDGSAWFLYLRVLDCVVDLRHLIQVVRGAGGARG